MNPEENLLRPDEVARRVMVPTIVPDRAPGRVFGIGLDVLSLIVAAIFGLTYLRYLAGLTSPCIVVAVVIVLGAITGLQAILGTDNMRRFWVALGQVALMAVFFYNFDFIFLLVSSLLMLGF